MAVVLVVAAVVAVVLAAADVVADPVTVVELRAAFGPLVCKLISLQG